ncbi:MAG: hypothetical protein GY889_15760 [Proteobacteria bacterium]|nr:hypothetical protein [Pseudomonadota bacterium]
MSSEVRANKLSPATGVTTTLGDASDVFQLPASAEIDIASGATLDVNGTLDVTGATVTGLTTGKMLQLQSATLASSDSTSSSASYIDTGLEVVITPTAATSKIVVWATVPAYVVASSRAQICYNLIEDASSTTLCEFLNRGFSTATNHMPQYLVSGVFSCSDTSALTFKTQMKLGTVAGTSSFYYLGYDTGATLTIIAMEVGA